jgi:hypothetical protein
MWELQGIHGIWVMHDVVPAKGGDLSRRYKLSVYTRGPWELQSQAVVHSIVGSMRR